MYLSLAIKYFTFYFAIKLITIFKILVFNQKVTNYKEQILYESVSGMNKVEKNYRKKGA